MSREYVLHKVRTALGRSVGQAPAPPPEPYLHIPDVPVEERIVSFRRALEALAGKTYLVESPSDVVDLVSSILNGRTAVASNAPYLVECGIAGIPGVQAGISDPESLREACANAGVGITSAAFALADTGTLVMIAGPSESRLVSLLPPVHIAVVAVDQLLTGLDELFTLLPDPTRGTSSMVLITGPSRTADIEQILVRGVHGPGEIHVILVAGGNRNAI